MLLTGTKLSAWSHPHSAMASKRAHVSIREALDSYTLSAKGFKYSIFLQGSYKNNTNLRNDSDVDVVLQLEESIETRVIALSGSRLEQDQSHQTAYQRWKSFRNQVLHALRATYGTNGVTSGRKSLKVHKNVIPAAADVVVTLRYDNGLAFYLPSEHRWVVSYPQCHYERGLEKEYATSNRYKRIIRMFKATRNHLENNHMINNEIVTSYFIECLLYNVPNDLFRPKLVNSYSDIMNYLSTVNLRPFKCQNGIQELFGPSKDLWNQNDARAFIRALRRLWNEWTESA